jgi:hypothetical protein
MIATSFASPKKHYYLPTFFCITDFFPKNDFILFFENEVILEGVNHWKGKKVKIARYFIFFSSAYTST